jgi:hypothetical protein
MGSGSGMSSGWGSARPDLSAARVRESHLEGCDASIPASKHIAQGRVQAWIGWVREKRGMQRRRFADRRTAAATTFNVCNCKVEGCRAVLTGSCLLSSLAGVFRVRISSWQFPCRCLGVAKRVRVGNSYSRNSYCTTLNSQHEAFQAKVSPTRTNTMSMSMPITA